MKTWMGKTTCDFCNTNVRTIAAIFYDAKTLSGQWALMCEPCFAENTDSYTLGTGKGQAYDSLTLKKVAG